MNMVVGVVSAILYYEEKGHTLERTRISKDFVELAY